MVKRPGVARREARHATAVDVTALLNAAEGLRYRDVLVLIAATGMRRGEALALRWTDIDLDAGLLTVRGTLGRIGGKLVVSEPKTDRSRRTVPLGAPLVAMLRARRKQQAAEQLRAANQRQTPDWCSPPNSGHRSSRATSCGPLRPPPQGRHGGGRGAHGGGTVADLLGHSSIAVTGDIYGHTSDDAARAAVDGLIGTLGLWQLVK